MSQNEHQHLSGHQARAIADANQLLALSRRAGRQYAMYFVLIGAAGAVAALLLAVMALGIALVVGLLVVACSVLAMVLFTRSHTHLVGQLNRFAMPFWIAFALGLVLAVVGAARDGRPVWLLCVGGTLCLLAGLVAGHFTDQISRRATTQVPTSATH